MKTVRLALAGPPTEGLAVPGMPAGSPGMPSGTAERDHVYTFDEEGAAPYATFVGPTEE